MSTHRFLLRCSLAFILGSLPIASAAPAPASDTAAKPADEKFKVAVTYMNGQEDGARYDETLVEAPPGTTALEAAKLAGLVDYLTDKAMLQITVNTDSDKPQTASVDVAAVRSGKAKDVVLAKSAGDATTGIMILYKDFEFAGGRPKDFVKALKEQFGVNWSAVHIPDALLGVDIPAFRKEGLKNSDNDCNAFNVVKLYNSIAVHYAEIGTWNWDGNVLKPNIVMLAGSKAAANEPVPMKVKAFPLAYIRRTKWSALENDVNSTADLAQSYSRYANRGKPEAVIGGRVSIQSDSEILVAIGSQSYIDMVDSLVAAYEKNEKVNNVLGPQPGGK